MDLKGLRTDTLRILLATNIHPPAHLPLLDEPSLRNVNEVIDRLFSLNAVAAAAYGFPKERAKAWLEQEEIWEKLEVEEIDFLDRQTGDTALFHWQVQGIFVLAWALGIIEVLDLWKPCPDDLVRKLPDLKSSQSTSEMRGTLVLRQVAEIAAAADLAYCLHWAVRNSRINGRPVAGKIEELEVMERRSALDWLLNNEDWYSVSLDT